MINKLFRQVKLTSDTGKYIAFIILGVAKNGNLSNVEIDKDNSAINI